MYIDRIQNGPSWGSDFCSKNGQKHWYLQCFVTVMGLKPLLWSKHHSPMIMAGKNFIYTKLVKQGVEPGTQNKEPNPPNPVNMTSAQVDFAHLSHTVE